ncbi:hypothetical protein EJ02DRAFT_452296 [Clathrospora elynae]|uniref:Uncharacterized protein n=1 Tax=Clathrospora elynae TaxID=706981 RepID=A0A6A5SVJ6_9PLEO|nr:hypothetical protein EJ02DRAFT_452296 [Clathrospora elynae]
MALSEELVQVDGRDIGLERSTITQQGQIELPDKNFGENDNGAHLRDPDNYAEPDARSSTHHVVNSLRQKKHDAGIKLRKTFHISKDTDDADKLDSTKSPILANTADVEKSGSRLDNNTAPEKHTVKDLMHNPVDTVKSKVSNQGNQQVAANIAAKEIPHGQEVDLVNASSAIDRARTENEKLLAIKNLSELLKERQSTYVRWSLDRHVSKVRALPRDTVVLKPRSAFEHRNPQGNIVVDWRAYGSHLLEYYAHRYGGQYIGYGSSPPTPSKETIMPNIERLIVATSPFQEFIMTTRRVYRWEKPTETSKYLVIYLVLWYFNLLLPGILSALLYLVAERRIHGQTMEDLREDIKHRENVQQTALSLTEFIEKQGDENWADDLLRDAGPWLMIQLADMASFFESVRNFYEWRKPTRTAAVLGVLGVSILVTALTPLWLLIKTSTLGAGFTFFCIFPISVNFPEYRLLVSPSKRLLWNIPTHPEWAIKFIQAEGLRIREHATDAPSALPLRTDAEAAKVGDYGFYNAHYQKSSGHLVIGTDSVRFVSKHPHVVHFTLPYDKIHNLEKQNRQIAKNVPEKLVRDSGKDLRLVDAQGREWVLKDVDQRDEAFSQIVGFSRTTWQVVW